MVLAPRFLRSSLLVLAAVATACASTPKPATVETRVEPVPVTGVRLQVVPPDAEVEIDGVNRGPASRLSVIALPSGVHRVSVRKAGYATWRAEITVASGVEPINVSLEPKQ